MRWGCLEGPKQPGSRFHRFEESWLRRTSRQPIGVDRQRVDWTRVNQDESHGGQVTKFRGILSVDRDAIEFRIRANFVDTDKGDGAEVFSRTERPRQDSSSEGFGQRRDTLPFLRRTE